MRKGSIFVGRRSRRSQFLARQPLGGKVEQPIRPARGLAQDARALGVGQRTIQRGGGQAHLIKLRHLILPMMWPIVLIAIIIRAIETFKIFDAPFLMTKGGPGDASQVIELFIYNQGIRGSLPGIGSAVAVILFVITMLLVIPLFRVRAEARMEETG